MRISLKITLLAATALILTSSILCIVAILQLNNSGNMAIINIEKLGMENTQKIREDGQQELRSFQAELLQSKKEYIRSQVQTAMSVLERAYETGHDLEKIKDLYWDQLQNVVKTAFNILEAMEKEENLNLEEKQKRASELI